MTKKKKNGVSSNDTNAHQQQPVKQERKLNINKNKYIYIDIESPNPGTIASTNDGDEKAASEEEGAEWKSSMSRLTKFKYNKERAKEREEERKQSRIDEGLDDAVTVERRQLGLIMGKQRANIRELEQRHQVKITIEDLGEEAIIRISGNDGTPLEKVQLAKDAVDYRTGSVNVGSAEARAWILQDWKTLSDIGKSTNTRIDFDSEKSTILSVRGHRDSVEDCILGINTHLDYFPLHQEMEKVYAELSQRMIGLCDEYNIPYTKERVNKKGRMSIIPSIEV